MTMKTAMKTLDDGALTRRDLAILRAVGRGTAEIVVGAQPDLYLDGRCCSDQMAAHRLARVGLITSVVPAAVGKRVAARLTDAGRLAAAPVDPAVVRPGLPFVQPFVQPGRAVA